MFQEIKNKFSELVKFIKDVANDPRIPPRDKKVLLALVALFLSPFDVIPDWIPIIGQIDDVVLLALILDYLFRVLDADLLLAHYPWGMKSFDRLRRVAGLASRVTPSFLKDRLWKYSGATEA